MTDDLIEKTDKMTDSDYVINPQTGRKIKVGGDLYKKLVKAKILGINPDDIGKVLYKGDSIEDCKQAVKKLPLPSKDLTPQITPQKKVVTKARKLKQSEMNKEIQAITLAVYEQNKDKFNDNMSVYEIQDLIKRLVNEKLISDRNEDIPIRRKIEFLVEKEPDTDEEIEYDDDNDDVNDDALVDIDEEEHDELQEDD